MSVSHPARGQLRGFTLVEVLTVVAIIAMLVALLVPAVLAARARARQAQCSNNQKNVSQAILQYQTAKGSFPGYVNAWSVRPPSGNPTDITVSWVVPVLEYLGRNDLMQTWREGDLHEHVVEAGVVRVAVLTCPSDTGSNPCPLSYVGNCGRPGDAPPVRANGVFTDRSDPKVRTNIISLTDIRDGAGQTLMLAERLFDMCEEVANNNPPLHLGCTEECHNLGQWTNDTAQSVGFAWDVVLAGTEHKISESVPWGPSATYPGLKSNHSGGVNVSFCDGHQQFLSENVNYSVFQLLATPDSQAARNALSDAEKACNLQGKLKEGDY